MRTSAPLPIIPSLPDSFLGQQTTRESNPKMSLVGNSNGGGLKRLDSGQIGKHPHQVHPFPFPHLE